jgi:hypothetical protein
VGCRHFQKNKQDRSYLIVALVGHVVHYCNGLSTNVKAIDNTQHCSDYAVINIAQLVTHMFEITIITKYLFGYEILSSSHRSGDAIRSPHQIPKTHTNEQEHTY